MGRKFPFVIYFFRTNGRMNFFLPAPLCFCSHLSKPLALQANVLFEWLQVQCSICSLGNTDLLKLINFELMSL